MKKFSVLAASVFVLSLLSIAFVSKAMSFAPVGCTAVLNTSEPPTISLSGTPALIQVDASWRIDCNGTSPMPPCASCATYQLYKYVQQTNGTYTWVAFGGLTCMTPEGKMTCQTTDNTQAVEAEYYSPPASALNQYKVTITIYPCSCDELELFWGDPLWTGSTWANLTP